MNHKIQWREQAYQDLVKLHAFLALENKSAARQAVERLLNAIRKLQLHPRIGARLVNIKKREVRKLIIGDYELRYEIDNDRIVILRFWHGRENR